MIRPGCVDFETCCICFIDLVFGHLDRLCRADGKELQYFLPSFAHAFSLTRASVFILEIMSCH